MIQIEISNKCFSLISYSKYLYLSLTLINLNSFLRVFWSYPIKNYFLLRKYEVFQKKGFFYFSTQAKISNVRFSLFSSFRDLLFTLSLIMLKNFFSASSGRIQKKKPPMARACIFLRIFFYFLTRIETSNASFYLFCTPETFFSNWILTHFENFHLRIFWL